MEENTELNALERGMDGGAAQFLHSNQLTYRSVTGRLPYVAEPSRYCAYSSLPTASASALAVKP